MKALVKKESSEGLWLLDVPKPQVGENDVLIKIERTAICGTDVHIFQWDEWAQKNVPVPMHVGHEFVGLIEQLGKSVSAYSVGDLVSGEGHIVCGHCRNCRAGTRHLCINTKSVGVNRPGAFAEFLCIPAVNVFPIPEGITKDQAAILDPLGNAVHSTLSFDLVGEDVLITGAGPIGILSAAVAKHVGARKVVITDLNEYRLDLARQMGADRTVNIGKENLSQVMKSIGMTEGFDVGLEMSGSPKALEGMIQSMKPGGKIALLGILPNETQIPWDQVVFKGLFLKGIYGREMFETWYKMCAMLQSGLKVEPIFTHRFSLKDFKKGQVMASLQEVADSIVHEISNSVSVILGYTSQTKEISQDGEITDEVLQKNLTRIEKHTMRVLKVIGGMFSLFQLGQNERFRNHEVKEIIESSVEFSGRNLNKAGILLEIGPIPQSLVLRCNGLQISQVFSNLIKNSFDAIADLEEKWITIEILDGNDHIEFIFTDSGPGISEDIRKHMLKPFMTTKGSTGGRGLGLSICEKVIRFHNGSLEIDSASENTCFVITLPK